MADAVQDEDQSRFFAPTSHWWLLSNSIKAERIVTGAVSFLDQIGATEDEMKTSFSTEWRRSFHQKFPLLITRKWKEVNWVSVKHPPGSADIDGKPLEDSNMPDYNNIVTSEMKVAVDSLRRCIDRGAAMFDRLSEQWDANYLADCLLGVKVPTRTGIAAAIAAKKSVPAMSVSLLAAAKKGSEDSHPDPSGDDDGDNVDLIDDGAARASNTDRSHAATNARADEAGAASGPEDSMADAAEDVMIPARPSISTSPTLPDRKSVV